MRAVLFALLALLPLLLASPARADTSIARAIWGTWAMEIPAEMKTQLAELEAQAARDPNELTNAMLEMMRGLARMRFVIGDGTIQATVLDQVQTARWTATARETGGWTMVTTDAEGAESSAAVTLDGDLLTIVEDGDEPMTLRRVADVEGGLPASAGTSADKGSTGGSAASGDGPAPAKRPGGKKGGKAKK